MISGFLAHSLLKPRRHPIKKNPGDYGMEFRDIEFASLDGVRLKGWHVPGATGKLVVMTNPMPFSRYGFSRDHQGMFRITGLEVELLKIVGNLYRAGYDVVIIDLRNHGESGEADGGYCTVGLNEWQDVAGLLKFIAGDDRLKSMPIGFMSLCTGANATIIAMSKAGELFGNARCLFALQPVSSDVFTRRILRAKYPLFSPFYNGVDRYIKRATGYSLAEMSPRSYVKDIAVPTTYAQVANDPWTEKSDVQAFYDGTRTEKNLIWLDGNERFDGYVHFGEHPEKMLEFFRKYL